MGLDNGERAPSGGSAEAGAAETRGLDDSERTPPVSQVSQFSVSQELANRSSFCKFCKVFAMGRLLLLFHSKISATDYISFGLYLTWPG